MKSSIVGTVMRGVSRQMLVAKKNSPTIMFVVGLTGVAAGTVLACRATLKFDEILEDSSRTLQEVKLLENSKYSEEDRTKDKVVIYTSLVFDAVKLYGPAIIVGGVGVACLTGSHNILTKRNAALTAAYAGLEKSYNAYRRRVAESIGEDKERQLHYEVTKEIVEKENEEAKVLGKKRKTPLNYSQYARFFDEGNRNWQSQPEMNKIWLQVQQQFANDLLVSQGHLFLNEVYDILGMDRSQAGAVVGWVYSGDGDGYVDFGIFLGKSDAARAFVNGWERSILLDFNVDGIIYDKIER